METNLYVFTASGQHNTIEHYADTIEDGFALERIERYLDEPDREALVRIEKRTGRLKAWGAVPGDRNPDTWKKLRQGDLFLIYRNGQYEYSARVAYTMHNSTVAKALWGVDNSGATWEYMFFLENIEDLSIPAEQFNRIVQYSPHYFPRGFGRFGDDVHSRILATYSSVEKFVAYLRDQEWVRLDDSFTPEDQENIIAEMHTAVSPRRQTGRANEGSIGSVRDAK